MLIVVVEAGALVMSGSANHSDFFCTSNYFAFNLVLKHVHVFYYGAHYLLPLTLYPDKVLF